MKVVLRVISSSIWGNHFKSSKNKDDKLLDSGRGSYRQPVSFRSGGLVDFWCCLCTDISRLLKSQIGNGVG